MYLRTERSHLNQPGRTVKRMIKKKLNWWINAFWNRYRHRRDALKWITRIQRKETWNQLINLPMQNLLDTQPFKYTTHNDVFRCQISIVQWCVLNWIRGNVPLVSKLGEVYKCYVTKCFIRRRFVYCSFENSAKTKRRSYICLHLQNKQIIK